ncbi:MAG: hypothetical protein IE937_11330 [Gammaproteobacteria bacterium]|nr:hypothetical protein [Gammaproteobacteria bacterium]
MSADVTLDFQWDINEDGGIDIELVSSKHPDLSIGSCTINEEELMKELDLDIEEFIDTGDDTALDDWARLADVLQSLSLSIMSKVEHAEDTRTNDRDEFLKRIAYAS